MSGTLGIYVADCCAVYLADPVRRVIALLHSGRKGSELGITTAVVARMRADFGCNPADITVQLSPCIRPPQYEIRRPHRRPSPHRRRASSL